MWRSSIQPVLKSRRRLAVQETDTRAEVDESREGEICVMLPALADDAAWW
jgi:hypothetical protein